MHSRNSHMESSQTAIIVASVQVKLENKFATFEYILKKLLKNLSAISYQERPNLVN